jgi:hypothetical protein
MIPPDSRGNRLPHGLDQHVAHRPTAPRTRGLEAVA